MSVVKILFISSFLFGYISLPGVPFDAQPWTLLIALIVASSAFKKNLVPK